ncbi:hypothetical protein lerEdw1_005790 [Lerista edwardsae]|nr:hypothetical protein lerEdw1_005790 [Lerista edwardsae]
MKRPHLRTVLVLCLVGMFLGDFQASGFPLQRRDLFPVKEVSLDMAPTSFDDQYKGCAEAMEAELEELNRTEFATNRVYAEAWGQAAALWGERGASVALPPGLRPEHAIALAAYTVQGRFHRDFNVAVREAGRTRDAYVGRFPFKAFHFLLTRALQVLGAAAKPRCQRVYRGVRGVRFTGERLQPIRFGHFASSSLRNESALQFGQDTFFTIETCHGVGIRNFSFFPDESEILIPPFETFKVANFTKAPGTTFIQLLSLRESSVHNCVLVKAVSLSHFCTSVPAPLFLWGLLLLASSTLGPPSRL